MVDDSCPHVVVSSLMAFINGAEQVHHVFKELASLIPLANTVDSLDYNLVNDLTSVPIDEHNPLIDEVPLCPKLDVDGLQHLNASDDVVQPSLRRLLTANLIHQNEVFHISFELCCHVKTCNDEVRSYFQEFGIC